MLFKTHLLAALAASAFALPAIAQDAAKEPAKPTTQSGASPKSPSMQECHDRMNAKKGSDATMNTDADKACADMMKQGEGAKATKKPAKPTTQSGEMPRSPNDAKTNNGK
jgi:hypothetical protein